MALSRLASWAASSAADEESGGSGDVGGSPAKGVGSAADGASAVRQRHEGNVVLQFDKLEQRWAVVHSITRQRVRLPPVAGDRGRPDEAELLFDDGWGVVGNSEGWTGDLEDLFTIKVFVKPDGSTIFWRACNPLDGEGVVEPFDELLREYTEGKVCLRGQGKADLVFSVAELKVARSCGGLLAWEMLDLYKVLQLGSYKSQAWRWVAHMLPVWQRLQSQSCGVLMRGAQIGAPTGEKDKDRNQDRSSCSTSLMLATLCRLLQPSQQSGGLQNPTQQLIVRWVFQQMVAFALQGATSLPVFLQARVVFKPYPEAWEGDFPGQLCCVAEVSGLAGAQREGVPCRHRLLPLARSWGQLPGGPRRRHDQGLLRPAG